jgi:hypothetical protein
VLDEVSAAIPGDASRRERPESAAQKAGQGHTNWHKSAAAFCVSLNPVVSTLPQYHETSFL